MNKLIFTLLLISPLIVISQTAEEKGYQIVSKAIDADRGFGSSSVDLKMVLKNKNGQVSERTLSNKTLELDEDGDKSMIIFTSPKDNFDNLKNLFIENNFKSDEPGSIMISGTVIADSLKAQFPNEYAKLTFTPTVDVIVDTNQWVIKTVTSRIDTLKLFEIFNDLNHYGILQVNNQKINITKKIKTIKRDNTLKNILKKRIKKLDLYNKYKFSKKRPRYEDQNFFKSNYDVKSFLLDKKNIIKIKLIDIKKENELRINNFKFWETICKKLK